MPSNIVSHPPQGSKVVYDDLGIEIKLPQTSMIDALKRDVYYGDVLVGLDGSLKYVAYSVRDHRPVLMNYDNDRHIGVGPEMSAYHLIVGTVHDELSELKDNAKSEIEKYKFKKEEKKKGRRGRKKK